MKGKLGNGFLTVVGPAQSRLQSESKTCDAAEMLRSPDLPPQFDALNGHSLNSYPVIIPVHQREKSHE